MLRIERRPGTITVVSRFSRPRALAVLTVALGGLAVLAGRGGLPLAAAALAVAALVIAGVGGRAVRAVFALGRVRVSAPVPLGRAADRPLSAFSAVRVETLADARRRKAEGRARAYRARAGGELPGWLRPADQPGGHDHLRRLVLDEARGAEPLAVTAWLADDDLDAARVELEALLGRG